MWRNSSQNELLSVVQSNKNTRVEELKDSSFQAAVMCLTVTTFDRFLRGSGRSALPLGTHFCFHPWWVLLTCQMCQIISHDFWISLYLRKITLFRVRTISISFWAASHAAVTLSRFFVFHAKQEGIWSKSLRIQNITCTHFVRKAATWNILFWDVRCIKGVEHKTRFSQHGSVAQLLYQDVISNIHPPVAVIIVSLVFFSFQLFQVNTQTRFQFKC